MTHICAISPVYPPEPLVSGQTTRDIADALTLRGVKVTVLTAFPNRPAGHLYPGWSRRLYVRQSVSPNQTIVRCFSFLSPESRLISRLLENVSFGVTTGAAVLFSRRSDVVYANTWPIFAMGLTAIAARLRRIPLVISIQDIYPESLVSQGRLTANSPLAAIMRAIDRHVARNSAAVILISEAFARIYRENRGVQADKLHVIPNWGDATAVASVEEGTKLRDALGIPPGEFTLVYGGNIGAAAGVEGVIEALGTIRVEERPYLLIAGSGSRLAACRALAQKVDAERIRFYTPWPAEKTAAVYAAADVLVLPTRGAQSLASVPSKLISYMLAARPVLAQALPGSDTAVSIERARCGWAISPDDNAALIEAIHQSRVATDVELARLGEAGRAYALQHLTREACLPKVMAILEQAATSRHATPPWPEE